MTTTHFTLAHENDPTQPEETLWFFQIKYTDVCDLASQLTALIKWPEKYINEQLAAGGCTKSLFLRDTPISLVFEYGPFMGSDPHGTWCVHGMDCTNAVSIRCPPIAAETSLMPLMECTDLTGITLTSLNVTYLRDPAIAFAHASTSTGWLDTDLPGYLIAFPRCCPGFINSFLRNPKKDEKAFLTINEAGPCAPKEKDKEKKKAQKYQKARFVLSPNFRFRYEWFPTAEVYQECFPIMPAMHEKATHEQATFDQCIKFAGAYEDGGSEETCDCEELAEILISIDEAWSLIWQTGPTSPTETPDK